MLVWGVIGCGGSEPGEQPAAEPAPSAAMDEATRDVWFHGRTLYEVHPRGFSAAGDLASVTAGIDRIAALGRPNLVVAPIYPTSGDTTGGRLGNLYAVRDHRAVDPALGSTSDLRALVDAAHERGMRILLDMVLTITADDHVAIADHRHWFAQDGEGRLIRPMQQWQDVAGFDHANVALRDYLAQTLIHWVEAAGVDGFRCALPTLAPDEFWRGLILDTRDRFPDLVFVAEASNDRYLRLGFDAVYVPSWKVTVDECRLEDLAMLGLREDIWSIVQTIVDRSDRERSFILFLEDHFHQRCAQLYPAQYLSGYAGLLMTMPGIPQLLMGQEIGSMTPVRPDAPWRIDWAGGDPAYRSIYERAARLRDASAALQRGEIAWVPTPDHDGMVYTRRTADEIALCAINLSNARPEFTLPDDLARYRWQEWDGRTFGGEPTALDGELAIPPGEYRVWRADL